ncbi:MULTISPECIES: PDGLE domain-containing protein [unclassified Rhodococcus (in: high G+C Gram-positive bacteria)]|uniref:PDGLE domain-containing protein n=1 Tax=unclassified Rhodococcus (in: high G+C Gram-positive bacteria) TaxID=192944 RepID=UPI000E0A1A77|nr:MULTISPECIES: PDGLE domain-containing protein [unclassified Rhodococcus (in: high G+C Gram-positive bacteria)]QKT13347.1 PDGLE domain-containing protein [Rhodococcus sp. W8901]RDI14696.1 cobalt/nickel transport protein [Rhodococcus sp. AG1013]
MTRTVRTRSWFLVGFAVAALLIAGVLSYFASSSPDGLDATTQRGCEVVETDGAEQLVGDCIAQNATDHHLSSSPLADYSIRGNSALTGVAGILGVVAVFVAAGLLFRVLARRRGP